ncbi:MAG: YjbQ family protein [Candidatus Altiarchaeales archaeon]|nr:YjbQ family protein [Candidatus Altiarchaeales archaeon]
MAVFSRDFRIKTETDGMFDITEYVADIVSESKLKDGIAVVFCPGSTGAISTVEFEPGLLKDVPRALEKIAPAGVDYEHHKTWHDDNGRSHVKSTLIGPSLTVPFRSKKLVLGTWQQIVFMEFDTSQRERNVVVQVLGD